MNTRIKNFGLLTTLLLSLILFQSFSKYDLTKTFSEEYNLNVDGTLDIYNKYGKVEIRSWDKQVAKIDVTVKVDARNEKKAEELLARINVEFTNNNNYVSAKTVISSDDNGSGWNISYNNNYTIDYIVYMPEKAHLKLFNKYGNSTVEALERSVDAEIKYGNISMDNVKGDVKLMLGYGNADIKDVRNLESEIKYSNMTGGNVGNLSMTSKYSKLKFQEVKDADVTSKYDTYEIVKINSLENEGKYDDFHIREASGVRFDTKYTQVDIDYLHEELIIDQKYGGVKIGELASTASLLDLDLEYTDVTVSKINTGYSLDMEGEHANYRIHRDFEVSYEKDDDDCCDVEIRGKYGNGATKIRAKMAFGNIKIRD